MNVTNTYITLHDLDRLESLIATARRTHAIDRDYLDKLEDSMLAKISIDSRRIPADVLTMNSRARLSGPSQGLSYEYTLVFPASANVEMGMISVLAPLGRAMLGANVGQTIEWTAGGHIKRLRVDEILYQPEAAGEFHL